jgi:fermentation-respiration switch protein FrsA (DUF1100 family)
MEESTTTLSFAVRLRRVAFRLLRSAAIIYVGVLVLMMLLENRLVYQGTQATQHWLPPPTGIVDVFLTTADGTRVHAWWRPGPAGAGALLYCHGNGGNLSHRGSMVAHLGDTLNCGVLIVDYPGYGKSQGEPSEAGCYAAAQAAYDWLTLEQKIAGQDIVLFGKSLGGGVAVELASRVEHRALVLVKTFTSLPDTAQFHYPWLPVHYVMRNRFDSIDRIASCRRPTFVAQAVDDEITPYSQGQRLFDGIPGPREFLRLEGRHNDGLPGDFFRAVKAFLDKHPR